ncbi:MAG: aminotransferase class V-fold PLP-dependent enzyme [Tissierellia bacterium]|nr:aminotransferase class V-fold PLP-dependent enzyme [Tissierellia bacterium]
MKNIYNWNDFYHVMNKYLPHWVGELSGLTEDSFHCRGAYDRLPLEDEEEIRSQVFSETPNSAEETLRFLMKKVYIHRWRPNHPHYLSFIPDAVTPYSILGDIFNAIENPYGGSGEISPGPALIEEQTLDFLGKLLNLGDKRGGVFTSGGSMSNLLAMVIARNKKLKGDFSKGRIYASHQAHLSVSKGAHILGFQPNQIISIKTDDQYRMDPADLQKKIQLDLKEDRIPFLVIGTAGTTNTGAVDPLDSLADICEEYHLWFHIDGAYGASMILSDQKDLIQGIHRGDSITWDGHKWLFQTYGCGILLVKNRESLLASFHAQGEYIEDLDQEDEIPNSWDMGLEMTRPIRGVKLWFTLQTLGLARIRQGINRCLSNGEKFAERISQIDDVRIITGPQMGIVNLRVEPKEVEEKNWDQVQSYLSKRGLALKNFAYLTTSLKKERVLRFCFHHPLMSNESMEALIDELKEGMMEIKKDPQRIFEDPKVRSLIPPTDFILREI